MTTIDAGLEPGRGRRAFGPSEFSWEGWKDILWRVWAEFGEDRVTLIAAGATFYLLLALFPALAAFVSIYGFVADPVTVADHIAFLGGLLPVGRRRSDQDAAAEPRRAERGGAQLRLHLRPGAGAVERQ